MSGGRGEIEIEDDGEIAQTVDAAAGAPNAVAPALGENDREHDEDGDDGGGGRDD